MADAFIECFWQVSTTLVGVVVPVLALFLVFRLVHDLLWR